MKTATLIKEFDLDRGIAKLYLLSEPFVDIITKATSNYIVGASTFIFESDIKKLHLELGPDQVLYTICFLSDKEGNILDWRGIDQTMLSTSQDIEKSVKLLGYDIITEQEK